METFTFYPNSGMELTHKPEITQIKFGDGYEQVAPKGINHNLRSYSLSFSGTESRIRQINDFLNQHGGYKAFLWTPPKSEKGEGKFRCYEWGIVQNTSHWVLSAEFKEVVL